MLAPENIMSVLWPLSFAGQELQPNYPTKGSRGYFMCLTLSAVHLRLHHEVSLADDRMMMQLEI